MSTVGDDHERVLATVPIAALQRASCLAFAWHHSAAHSRFAVQGLHVFAVAALQCDAGGLVLGAGRRGHDARHDDKPRDVLLWLDLAHGETVSELPAWAALEKHDLDILDVGLSAVLTAAVDALGFSLGSLLKLHNRRRGKGKVGVSEVRFKY